MKINLDSAKIVVVKLHLSILLHKLQLAHVSEPPPPSQVLMDSVLSNKRQCVHIWITQSSFQNISCDAPQGAIRGCFVLLFLIYTNDIGSGLLYKSFDLYDYDSIVHSIDSDSKKKSNEFRWRYHTVADWCGANIIL